MPVFLLQLVILIAFLLSEVFLQTSFLSLPYLWFVHGALPDIDPPPLHPYFASGLLFVSVTTLILFFASGMYSEKIAYANRYVFVGPRSCHPIDRFCRQLRSARKSRVALSQHVPQRSETPTVIQTTLQIPLLPFSSPRSAAAYLSSTITLSHLTHFILHINTYNTHSARHSSSWRTHILSSRTSRFPGIVRALPNSVREKKGRERKRGDGQDVVGLALAQNLDAGYAPSASSNSGRPGHRLKSKEWKRERQHARQDSKSITKVQPCASQK